MLKWSFGSSFLSENSSVANRIFQSFILWDGKNRMGDICMPEIFAMGLFIKVM